MKHEVAVWAGCSAALGTLGGSAAAALVTDERIFQTVGQAIFTAAVVGGAMYARERLAEAKRE